MKLHVQYKVYIVCREVIINFFSFNFTIFSRIRSFSFLSASRNFVVFSLHHGILRFFLFGHNQLVLTVLYMLLSLVFISPSFYAYNFLTWIVDIQWNFCNRQVILCWHWSHFTGKAAAYTSTGSGYHLTALGWICHFLCGNFDCGWTSFDMYKSGT